MAALAAVATSATPVAAQCGCAAAPCGFRTKLRKALIRKRLTPEVVAELKDAGFDGGKVRITHVRNPRLAGQFAELVKTTWPASDVAVSANSGLCSYYAESGAILVAFDY